MGKLWVGINLAIVIIAAGKRIAGVESRDGAYSKKGMKRRQFPQSGMLGFIIQWLNR
tara:strand:- start:228 stop:398 length:171 start_codon:yes stop_codon:yes gene_type:complete